MTEDDFKAALTVIYQTERLNDQFLKLLVQHLATVLPEFEGSTLLESLYLQQEQLPGPDQHPNSEALLRYWKHKIDLTEKALANAEKLRQMSGGI